MVVLCVKRPSLYVKRLLSQYAAPAQQVFEDRATLSGGLRGCLHDCRFFSADTDRRGKLSKDNVESCLRKQGEPSGLPCQPSPDSTACVA